MNTNNTRTILEQIEYYFSDLNYSTDSYLHNKTDINYYIPLDTVLSFKKVKEYNSSKSDIINVLKQSNFLELSDDETQIRRKNQMCFAEAFQTIIKIKWIPTSLNESDIKEFFSTYGDIVGIRMCFIQGTNTFKGTALIQFSTPNSVDEIIKTQPKYKEKELFYSRNDLECRWLRIKDKEMKPKGLLCVLDEENGDTVMEIPKYMEFLLQTLLNGCTTSPIAASEFLKVKNQLKRTQPTTTKPESSTEEQPKPKKILFNPIDCYKRYFYIVFENIK
ncbi:La ribonucleoprotein [Entamoeba marina]